MNYNLIQLYRTFWFAELVNSNKLSYLRDNKTFDSNLYLSSIVEYAFKRYENIDKPLSDLINNIDLSDVTPEKTCMVICYKELETDKSYSYIWEYATNWTRIRNNNGTN